MGKARIDFTNPEHLKAYGEVFIRGESNNTILRHIRQKLPNVEVTPSDVTYAPHRKGVREALIALFDESRVEAVYRVRRAARTGRAGHW